MSQTTSLILYSTKPLSDPKGTLLACLQASGAPDCMVCSRSTAENKEWDLFLGDPEASLPEEWIGKRVPLTEVPQYYQDARSLLLDLGVPPMARRIHDAVLSDLSKEVYGSHVPGNMSTTIGGHDIFESSENENGKYFGRASLSISFWNTEVPPNFQNYRQAILGLAEVQSVKRELEAIAGALEACVVYHV